jgi:hypothetical protein
MTPTMSFGSANGTFIVAHGEEAPAPEEWTSFLSEFETALPSLTGLLVFSAGAATDARQREQIEELTKRGKLRVAVLTDSIVVRGTVTALSWFDVQVEAFAPNNEYGALDHLGVDPTMRPDVLARLREIKARVV